MATLLLIREIMYCLNVIGDPHLPDTNDSCVNLKLCLHCSLWWHWTENEIETLLGESDTKQIIQSYVA